MKIPINWN